MAQRKHLDDFLRDRIIGRLKCGRTQLKVSEELGIAQRVISRLWQQFQDDGNSTASDLSRQLSSATGTTVSRQTVYRRLGHIGLYAQHALWTPQQWSCVMFSDESRFSLQSDSRRTLIWRAPGTRYHQENTIERHRYDECLQSEDITRMDWTAYSSDLNPIEHVWDMLGRRIASPTLSDLSTGTSEGIA
ncbi:transposable element Tcb1 transposase [Trichonephila clavipes]|nr:transposable element Tcb1 transposase [Trichonephila clavipes]